MTTQDILAKLEAQLEPSRALRFELERNRKENKDMTRMTYDHLLKVIEGRWRAGPVSAVIYSTPQGYLIRTVVSAAGSAAGTVAAVRFHLYHHNVSIANTPTLEGAVFLLEEVLRKIP